MTDRERLVLARLLTALLLITGVGAIAAFAVAFVVDSAWELAGGYALLLCVYALALPLRRLAERPGAVWRWIVAGQEREDAVRFHVLPLVVLICVVGLQILAGWPTRRLAPAVRVGLLISVLFVGIAYLADLVYELRNEHNYLPPPRDPRAL